MNIYDQLAAISRKHFIDTGETSVIINHRWQCIERQNHYLDFTNDCRGIKVQFPGYQIGVYPIGRFKHYESTFINAELI